MRSFIAYTDGSYQSSINAGGWASIILDENENHIATLYQGMTHTTNNRMELRAVIETIKYFEERVNLTIVSDSLYVIETITSGNALNIVKNNQIDRPNFDLWFELSEVLDRHELSFVWVKGHDGNRFNEEADKWCVFAARCLEIPRDIWTIDSEQERLEATGI